MEDALWQEMVSQVCSVQLPSYEEIPDGELFLDQVAQYVSAVLSPLSCGALTGSMISNYVKRGLISRPIRKQYTRDQIAYLLFIAVAKPVLSLDEIQNVIRLQQLTQENRAAYQRFRRELSRILTEVFRQEDGENERSILRNILLAAAHKAYLDCCMELISRREAQAEREEAALS